MTNDELRKALTSAPSDTRVVAVVGDTAYQVVDAEYDHVVGELELVIGDNVLWTRPDGDAP